MTKMKNVVLFITRTTSRLCGSSNALAGTDEEMISSLSLSVVNREMHHMKNKHLTLCPRRRTYHLQNEERTAMTTKL